MFYSIQKIWINDAIENYEILLGVPFFVTLLQLHFKRRFKLSLYLCMFSFQVSAVICLHNSMSVVLPLNFLIYIRGFCGRKQLNDQAALISY